MRKLAHVWTVLALLRVLRRTYRAWPAGDEKHERSLTLFAGLRGLAPRWPNVARSVAEPQGPPFPSENEPTPTVARGDTSSV